MKILNIPITEQQVTVAGDGSQTRDFVHVSDIVDANIRAAAQGSPGSIYNIGSGIATSIHELASIIIEQVSQEVTIETDETVSTGITHSQADISKAEKELDFSPTKSIRTFIEPMRTQIQST
jgi:UDP-glucose 4-epimerase